MDAKRLVPLICPFICATWMGPALTAAPRGFDHGGISNACAACHDGVTAPGKPEQHIPAGLDCESCHSTDAWKPARREPDSAAKWLQRALGRVSGSGRS